MVVLDICGVAKKLNVASSPGSCPLSVCRRKEPGSIGGQTVDFSSSARVPPIRLQKESMRMRDSLKAWQTIITTRSDKTAKTHLLVLNRGVGKTRNME